MVDVVHKCAPQEAVPLGNEGHPSVPPDAVACTTSAPSIVGAAPSAGCTDGMRTTAPNIMANERALLHLEDPSADNLVEGGVILPELNQALVDEVYVSVRGE